MTDDETPCGTCGHQWQEHQQITRECLAGHVRSADHMGWVPGPDSCECLGWVVPS